MKSINNTKTRQAKNAAKVALANMNDSSKTRSARNTGLKRKAVKVCEGKGSLDEFVNIANTEDRSDNSNRKRWKTLNEREVLECYFELDQEWTRPTMLYVKDLVHLSEKQIYKWGYEKRRRLDLITSHDKTIEMKFVSKAEDLHKSISGKDFNNIVDSLFCDEESEEETLSDEQKEVYDYVRNQLIQRSSQYELQSDLDKLLNERIPIKNIAFEAKRSLNFTIEKNTTEDKINVEHLKFDKNKSKMIENAKDFAETKTVIHKPLAICILDLFEPVGKPVDYDNQKVLNENGQIGSDFQDNIKDSNNSCNLKDTTTLEEFSDPSECFSFGTPLEHEENSYSECLPKDTFVRSVLPKFTNSGNFNRSNLISKDEDEC